MGKGLEDANCGGDTVVENPNPKGGGAVEEKKGDGDDTPANPGGD